MVRAAGADELADQLDRALADDVSLLARETAELALERSSSTRSKTRRRGLPIYARCS